MKRKLVDLENHIRGSLRIHGLRVGSIARGKFEARVRELLEGADWAFERMIDCMLEVRRRVVEGYDRLHTMVLSVVAADPVCRRFMTVPGVGPIAALTFKVVAMVARDETCARFMRIPGVGPISALAFKTAVDDPRRFRRSRTVGAYLGLTSRRWQSGASIDNRAEEHGRVHGASGPSSASVDPSDRV